MTIDNPPDNSKAGFPYPFPEAPAPVPAINVHIQRAEATEPRKARDRAQYVRQQKGHSLILWLFVLGPMTLWIPTIYFAASPNHYWHA